MATRVHALAVHVLERTTATRRGCGRTATTSEELRDNIAGLPGYGTMKIKALGSVLFNRFGVELAQPLIPWHPTLGDVDSAAGAEGLPGVQEGQQGRSGSADG